MGQGNEIIVRVDGFAKLSLVISVIDRLKILDAGGFDVWLSHHRKMVVVVGTINR